MLIGFNARTRNLYDNSINNEIDFTMAGSEYQIQDIEGLGPVDTTLNTSTKSVDPGVTVDSNQDGSRNIVVTLGFTPNSSAGSTISSLRQALYKVFTPGMFVEMDFLDDTLGTFRIWGNVEKHTPDIFNQNPTVQLSLLCGDPYFVKVDSNGNVVTQTITPTVNTVSVLDGAVTIYGFEVDSPCSIPIPMVLQYKMGSIAQISGLTLVNMSAPVYEDRGTPVYPGASIGANNSGWMVTNVTVQIDSVKGERALSYIPAGQTTPIEALPDLSGELAAFLLHPGKNQFLFPSHMGDSYSVASASVLFTPLYDGI